MQGFVSPNIEGGAYLNGWSASEGSPEVWSDVLPRDGDLLATLADPAAGEFTEETATSARARGFRGYLSEEPHSEFFESIIVIPRSKALGFVLADTTFAFDVYNAYRYESRTLTAYDNNSDQGITPVNLPSLPFDFPEQWGFLLEFSITGVGAPVITGTLDLTFDTETILLAISGTRAIIVPYQPEVPVIEHLLFKTGVLRKRDGREQRLALRTSPRQAFELEYLLDGLDRERLDAILFDSGARALGVPVWFEPMILVGDCPAGSLDVTVDETAFSDLRAPGTAILYRNADYFESVAIDDIVGDNVQFQNITQKDFQAGDMLYPVRVAFPSEMVRGSKVGPSLQQTRLVFAVQDNDVDLSDASGFASLNGRVLLDDPNAVEDNVLSESLVRKQFIFDGETGSFRVTSPEEQGRRSHQKQWVCTSREELWQLRQLIHFLKGRTTAFYIPTFFTELRPTGTVVSSSDQLTITNIGYTKFYQARSPRNVVRILKTDGTYFTSTVIDSEEDSEEEETLTVDPAWSETASLDEIDRVDLLTKVRMDSDDVVIRHQTATGQALGSVPVTEVFE